MLGRPGCQMDIGKIKRIKYLQRENELKLSLSPDLVYFYNGK